MMTNKLPFRNQMKINIRVIYTQLFSLFFAALVLISPSAIDKAKADRHQEAELEKQVKQQAETEKAQKTITYLTEPSQNKHTQKAIITKLTKKLKNKLTPRVIIKTKKWVSILIITFGVFMLFQGVLPSGVTKNIERLDVQFNHE